MPDIFDQVAFEPPAVASKPDIFDTTFEDDFAGHEIVTPAERAQIDREADKFRHLPALNKAREEGEAAEALADAPAGIKYAAQRGLKRAQMIPAAAALALAQEMKKREEVDAPPLGSMPPITSPLKDWLLDKTGPWRVANTPSGDSAFTGGVPYTPPPPTKAQILAKRDAVEKARARRDIWAGTVDQMQQELEKIPRSATQQKMAEAQTQGEKWDAFRKNPFQTITSIGLESLPPSLAGTFIGGAVGGPAGAVAGTGAGSFGMEFSSEFLNEAQKHGYKPGDPESLIAFLDNKEAFNKTMDKALTRASIVSAVDTVTAGTAGKIIGPALNKGLRTTALGALGEAGVQAVGGSGGELLAQAATKKKDEPFDVFDIAMEAAAETFTTPGEVLSNLRRRPPPDPPGLRRGSRNLEPTENLKPGDIIPGTELRPEDIAPSAERKNATTTRTAEEVLDAGATAARVPTDGQDRANVAPVVESRAPDSQRGSAPGEVGAVVPEAAPGPQVAPDVAQIVSGMNAEQFMQWGKTTPGGLTPAAHDYGRNATSQEQVDALQAMQAKSKTETAQAAKAGNFDDAMTLAVKTQFFREAYEAATGTGSAGEALPKKYPDYKPPFPVQQAAPVEEPPAPPAGKPVEQMTPEEAVGYKRPRGGGADILPSMDMMAGDTPVSSRVGENLDHAIEVATAARSGKPVSAAAVEAYGIKLPEGWTQRGNLWHPPSKPAPASAPPALWYHHAREHTQAILDSGKLEGGPAQISKNEPFMVPPKPGSVDILFTSTQNAGPENRVEWTEHVVSRLAPTQLNSPTIDILARDSSGRTVSVKDAYAAGTKDMAALKRIGSERLAPKKPTPTSAPPADVAILDMLGAKHDLTGQQAEMVLKAFKTLPQGSNPESLQKAYLKLALPADMPAEVGLGKVADIKGAKQVLSDLREASAGVKALPVGESKTAGPTTRSTPPPAKSGEGARETGTSIPETKPAIQPGITPAKPTLRRGARQEETKPPVSRWAQIGVNFEGAPVYADPNGVRSFVRNGVRSTEAVGLRPSESGVNVLLPDAENRGSDFLTKEEFDKKQKPAAPEQSLPFRRRQTDGYLVGLRDAKGVETKTELYPTQQAADSAMESLRNTGEHPPIGKPSTGTDAKIDDIRKRREDIKARLRAKFGQTNIGVDPEIATLAAELAVNYAEEGVVRFADFAKRVKADLPDIWERLKHYLGGAWRTAGEQNMDLDETTRGEAKAVIEGLDTETAKPEPAPAAEPDKKADEEAAESAIIKQARAIATAPGNTLVEAFRKLVALYRQQPRLGTRTVTSKTNQAYSTPAPLAFLVGVRADLANGTQIAEPTAGNGMLYIAAPENAGWIANELDPARNERLKATFPRAIMSQMDASTEDFHDYLTQMKPDRAVMNPPFGGVIEEGTTETKRFPIINASTAKATTPSIDLAIALNTLDALTPDGKAVVIIGAKTGSPHAQFGSPEGRARAYNRPEMLEFFKRFNVTDWFTVDGGLYEKMGAGWPVDVIVIDGKRPTPGSAQGGLVRPWVTPPPVFKTWESLESKLYETQPSTTGTPRGEAGGIGGGTEAPRVEGRPERGPGGLARGPRQGGGTPPVASPVRPERPQEPVAPVSRPAVVPESRPEQPGRVETVGQPAAVPEETGAGGAPLVERETVLNVPYKSVSKNADPKLVVPANIADAMRRAVQKLEVEVGKTVDAYVAEKMGWTEKELFKHLSSAQIEATGLFIRNSEVRKTGLINSDQTGVGKGRVVGSVLEYARRNGKIYVFITQGKHLYSDMIGRDLPSIGVKDFKPFITDSGYAYLDGNGNEIAETHSAKERRELMKEFGALGALPAEFDGVFTTYFQLQADKPENWKEKSNEKFKRKKKLEARPDGPRLAMLRKIAPNAIFVLDEAHMAAGLDSDVGLSLQSILKDAAGVFYASATFAKRPDNLTLYSLGTGLKLAGLNPKEMAALFQSGGVPMQQALTTMLAEEGEFVRREQDMSGVKVSFKQVSGSPEQEAEQADTYTSFLRDLHQLSDSVNQAAAEQADAENQVRPEDSQVDLTSVNFGARLFNLSSQYLFSLRAESTSKEAVAALKRGQKPFIAVYNTMAGPIADLVTMKLPLNFGGLLRREMAKMLTIRIKDPSAEADPALGTKKGERLLILKPEDLPDGGAFYRQLEEQIQATDFGAMPISPIDAIKKSITQAGYKVGEITAREGEVDETGGVTTLSKREKRDRNKVLFDYNNGVLDVVIVNGSGSTGLSAHADPRFKDQRQRYMIVAQAAPDINVFMQMLGRVMRFGQTSLPEFSILTTTLAAERRFMTMLRGKLTSLNANTSADTESGITQGGLADDIFNQIGDEIVAEVVMAHPELASLARIDLPDREEEGGGMDNYARYATGRFVLLPNDDAAKLWNDIGDLYTSRIRALDEAGENPLKANVQDLRAQVTGTAIIEDAKGKTAFDGPVTLDRVNIQPARKPYSYAEATTAEEANLDENRRKYREWLTAQKVAAKERLDTMERREATPEQMDRTRETMRKVEENAITASSLLGKVVAVDPTGSGTPAFYAIPISLELRSKETGDFSSSSKHTIKLATNTLRRTINLPLSQLDSLKEVEGAEAEAVFDENSESTTTRYIAGTNLLRAYSVAGKLSINITRPSVTIYTTRNGQLKTGVLMGAAFNPATGAGGARKQIVSADDFVSAVQLGTPLTAGLVKIAGNEVRVPSGSVARPIWGDRQFSNFFLRDPVERGGEFRGNLDSGYVRSFYEFLRGKGTSIFEAQEGQTEAIKFTEPTAESKPSDAANKPPNFAWDEIGPGEPQTISRELAQETIARFRESYPNVPEITLVDSETDLPAETRAGKPNESFSPGAVVATLKDGSRRIFVIFGTGSTMSVERLNAVLAHEAIGHKAGTNTRTGFVPMKGVVSVADAAQPKAAPAPPSAAPPTIAENATVESLDSLLPEGHERGQVLPSGEYQSPRMSVPDLEALTQRAKSAGWNRRTRINFPDGTGQYTFSKTPDKLAAAKTAKANAALDREVEYKGQNLTPRQIIDAELQRGANPVAVEVPDNTRFGVLNNRYNALKGSYPMGNPNHPLTIEFQKVKAELEAGPKKTVYRMQRNDGSYMPISKTEFDYAASRKPTVKDSLTAPESKPSDAANKIADALENIKSGRKPGDLQLFGVIPAVWDAAVSIAQGIIRAGGKVADAVAAALAHINANHKGEWDEAQATDALTMAAESTGRRASVDDADAQERAATEQGLSDPADDQVPLANDQWVPTVVKGKTYYVRGRDQLTPESTERSFGVARDAFEEAGFAPEERTMYDPGDKQTKSFLFLPQTTDAEANGKKLVTILDRELKDQRAEGKLADHVAALVVSVRENFDMADSAIGQMTTATRNKLFALAQEEASWRGRALRALANFKADLIRVSRNVDVFLNRIHVTAFDPDGEVSAFVRDVGKALEGELSAEDIAKLRDKLADPKERQRIIAAIKRALATVKAKRKLGWKTMRDIERLIESGIINDDEAIAALAKKHGWRIPTDEQKAEMRRLADRRDALLKPTQVELDKAGSDTIELERLHNNIKGAVREEVLKIEKRLATMWSEFTKPVKFREGWNFRNTWVQRENNARFINELITANILFRASFATKQAIDITTQWIWRMPMRAIAQALELRHDALARGEPGVFWRDASKQLTDIYKDSFKSLKPAVARAIATWTGRAEVRNVERLMSGVNALERIRLRAELLDADGRHAEAFLLKFVGLVRYSFRLASAFDYIHGTPAEWNERRYRVIQALRAQGLSAGEADVQAGWVMDSTSSNYPEALALTKSMHEARGLESSEEELRESAWNMVERRQFQMMNELGLPADDIEANSVLYRNTLGWNEAETRGVGGLLGGVVSSVGRGAESVGLPLAIGRFGNAIAIGINRTLHRTPLYALANMPFWPGSRRTPSSWSRTKTDIYERRLEAAVGTTFGSVVLGLVMAGVAKVWLKPPPDPEERQIWEKQGHKAGTIEFDLGDGKFSVWSLTTGPMSLFAPYAAAGGALNELAVKREKAQAKLDADAAKRGVTPGRAPAADVGDWFGVALKAAQGSILGNRTTSGLLYSSTDYGLPNVQKFVASQIGPIVPGLPAYQEMSRMSGVIIDPNKGSMADLLFPLPTSKARKLNLLGDPVGTEDDVQRIVQTLTGGNYPVASGGKDLGAAYQALITSGFRPPSIDPNRGRLIGGEYRPFTSSELERYTEARGRNLKAELGALGATDDRKAVQAAYERANTAALRSVGVNVTEPASRSASGRPASRTAPSDSAVGNVGRTGEARSGITGRTRYRGLRRSRLSRGLSRLSRGRRLGRGRLSRATRLRQPRLGRLRRRGLRAA